MFTRLRESRKRDQRLISKGKVEGRVEGKAEAYQEMRIAWEQRREAAEAKGLEFNEPRPEPPENKDS